MDKETYIELGNEKLEAGDVAGATENYLAAYGMGDPIAAYNLGCIYFNGDDGEKDLKKAFEWYKKASEMGDEEATNVVGECYENGYGVNADPARAVVFYTKAAIRDCVEAMVNLAFCYLEGKGVEKQYSIGLTWLDKASEYGDGYASFMLGTFFLGSEYVQRDPDLARIYFERGVDSEYAPAAEALSDMYREGNGVEKDEVKADELKALADEFAALYGDEEEE